MHFLSTQLGTDFREPSNWWRRLLAIETANPSYRDKYHRVRSWLKEQKHAYEVKKAYIDQKRILCTECWKESNEIANGIRTCEENWAESKDELKNNSEFLSGWLGLLTRLEEYVPYRPNTAIKNMLKKLLDKQI